jgi:hypothetical protein
MTECTQSKFAFQAHFSRQVTGQFDGSPMTSDAGGLLLRETDRRLHLLPRLAQCFLDGRDGSRVQHSVAEMISQRVAALALGYEDLNDHEQLRQDPVLKLLAGREDLEQPLAGKSTLNRLELGAGAPDRYKKITFWKQGIDELLVDVFLEAHVSAPERIVLDIDTTDVALHGGSGRPLLSRLLRSLLLPAAVHLLRRALIVRAPAQRQHGCLGRKPDRDPAHRGTDSHALASGAHHATR